MDIGRRIREVREDRGMPRTVLARRVGVADNTIWRIEAGRRTPSLDLLEKVARELRTEPAELMRDPALGSGKGEAPQGTGRAEWDAAVRNARQLRKRGWQRMEELLSLWRASKERGDSLEARRGYLDEMGGLLQQAYDAETVLMGTLARPLNLAEVDLDEFAQLQTAGWFYGELRRLVTEGAGLSIREGTGHDDTAMRSAHQDSHPARTDTSWRPGYPMEVHEAA
jgi:transcriptional regulator with XRE-family HTH domain